MFWAGEGGQIPEACKSRPTEHWLVRVEVDDWIAAKAAKRSTGNDADPVESADERKAENAELYPEDQGAGR